MVGKIAFLFLTISEINHEQAWINFFRGQENRYSVYIHSKNNFNPLSAFKKNEISVKVPTSWEKIVEAQFALLQAAFQDPLNEKFVYVSESTIPLQSFEEAYQKLMNHPHSMFFYEVSPNKERNFKPLDPKTIYKNSTWVVLNRKHVELMLKDREMMPIMANGFIGSEHYPSTFLKSKNLLAEVIKEDITYDLWVRQGDSNPWTFKNSLKDKYLRSFIEVLKKKKHLFGRKFAKQFDVLILDKYIYHKK